MRSVPRHDARWWWREVSHAMRFGMSRSHRMMMHDRVRDESVVGNVLWPVARRPALFNWLLQEPRCAVSLGGGATLVSHTLSSALIKCVALALEACHRPRISVAGPNIQLLTAITRLVGVEQAEVLIETFVDRRRGSPAATGREHEKAERETPSASKATFLPCSRVHVQASSATVCLRSSNAGSKTFDAILRWSSGQPFRPVAVYKQASTFVYSLCVRRRAGRGRRRIE